MPMLLTFLLLNMLASGHWRVFKGMVTGKTKESKRGKQGVNKRAKWHDIMVMFSEQAKWLQIVNIINLSVLHKGRQDTADCRRRQK